MYKKNKLPVKVITDYPQLKVSFRDFVIEFLKGADLAEATRNSYKYRLKIFIQYLEEKKVELPVPQTIVEYKRYLVEKLESANTILNYIVALRSFFRFLENNHLYPDVCVQLRPVRRPSGHRKSALTLEQIQTLLNSMPRFDVKTMRDFALLKTLLTLGLRIGEAYSLNIGDIVIDNGLRILKLKRKGQHDKEGKVALADGVYFAIRDYLNAREREFGIEKGQPLFISLSTNCLGERLSKRTLSGIAKKNFRRIGLDCKELTAHSCRHSALSLAILNNSLIDVQNLAGHSSPVTTTIYLHKAKFDGHVEKSVDDLIEGNSED